LLSGEHQGKRRGRLPHLVAAALALLFARAQNAMPVAPSVTVLSQSPSVELQFHGLALKSVRADDAQNAVSLDFDGPIDGRVFDELQQTLPGWVAMSYAGYDSAIIRASRPVSFLTRPEGDGFSLRMVPRQASSPATASNAVLRGPIIGAPANASLVLHKPHHGGDPRWPEARLTYLLALAQHPDDLGLRRAYDLAQKRSTLQVQVSGGWRENHGGSTIYDGHLSGWAEVEGPVAVTGHLDDAYGHASSVRQLDGTFARLNKNAMSGGIGVAYDYPNGSRAAGEITYAKPGVGAQLSVDIEDPVEHFATRGVYREAYTDTTEAIADDAARDYGEIDAMGRLYDGLWATGELRLTRYGVHGDANVAHTIGFAGGLSYLFPQYEGVTAGAHWTMDGEYTLGVHRYPGPSATTFIPLSIRTREVHDFTGSLSSRVLDDVWLDAYGGYTIDRYGSDGALYGGALRWSLFPEFDILIGAQHTQVASRQGVTGPETSAQLTLTYR
jgi:hypothetical protein